MSMKITCGEFVGLAYANDDELRKFAEEILAENAKLRELVSVLYPSAYYAMSLKELSKACDLMRGLGIEVD